MKRIYEEYLHVPEDGKLKEKVFIMRIAVAIVCVVCCLSAMGFSAYAYFTSSITSSANTIKAASYSADAEITKDGSPVTAEADNPLDYLLENAGTYQVTLKATGTATTGYCKIEVTQGGTGEEQPEKMATIFTTQMAPGDQMIFTLVVNTAVQVVITPQWGTYSNRDIVISDGMTQEILFATESSTTSTDTTTNASVPEQQSEPAAQNPGETSTGTSEDTTGTPTETSTDTQTSSTETGKDEESVGNTGDTDTDDGASEGTGGDGTTEDDEDKVLHN